MNPQVIPEREAMSNSIAFLGVPPIPLKKLGGWGERIFLGWQKKDIRHYLSMSPVKFLKTKVGIYEFLFHVWPQITKAFYLQIMKWLYSLIIQCKYHYLANDHEFKQKRSVVKQNKTCNQFSFQLKCHFKTHSLFQCFYPWISK